MRFVAHHVSFDAPEVARIVRRLTEQEGVQATDAHLGLSGYCTRCRKKER